MDRSGTSLRTWWVLSLAGLIIVGTGVYLYHVIMHAYGLEASQDWYGDFAPLYARSFANPHVEQRVAWPAIVATLAIAAWIGVVTWRTRWTHWLLLPAFVVVLIVNAAVARMDGPDALTYPFSRTSMEYFGDVQTVGVNPIQFIEDYPALIEPTWFGQGRKLSGHARTHPPGGVLVLWVASRAIGPSIEVAAWTAITLSALSVVPALLWMRELLDEQTVAVAAGLYVAVPGLVMFGATCMDGVFMLPIVTTLWLGERALRGRRWTRMTFAATAGLACAVALFLSFTASAIGVFFLCRLIMECIRRRWAEATALALAGGVAFTMFVAAEIGLALATGYDLHANLRASIAADAEYMGSGTETFARYLDVSTANIVAFLIAAGIATTAAATLGLWRNAKLAAYGLAILLLAFSTLYTLETERVWLAFHPVIAAGAAVWIARLPEGRHRSAGLMTFATLVLLQTLWFEWSAYTHW